MSWQYDYTNRTIDEQEVSDRLARTKPGGLSRRTYHFLTGAIVAASLLVIGLEYTYCLNNPWIIESLNFAFVIACYVGQGTPGADGSGVLHGHAHTGLPDGHRPDRVYGSFYPTRHLDYGHYRHIFCDVRLRLAAVVPQNLPDLRCHTGHYDYHRASHDVSGYSVRLE